MDPLITLLTTAIGAVAGTSVGLMILYRRLRPPISDSELADLKAKLRSNESSLAAATANLEDLRKQLAFQEKTILQNGADLQKRQEQLDLKSAEVQKEKILRSAAEESAEELTSELSILRKQCSRFEGQVTEASNLASERGARLASLEPELEVARNKLKELAEQAARVATETAELKRASEHEAGMRAALEAELEAARTRIAEMSDQTTRSITEAGECKRIAEHEVRLRTALEAQLKVDQERMLQLSAENAELRNERLQLEARLQEERGSAAKGMELLMVAQEKLASVFKALGTEVPNGNPTKEPAANPGAGPNAEEFVSTR